MTHCRSLNVASSSRAMSGSATLTIVMSSSSMNVARHTASRVHHLRSMTAEITEVANRTAPIRAVESGDGNGGGTHRRRRLLGRPLRGPCAARRRALLPLHALPAPLGHGGLRLG